jgi:hypothetical protein
LNLGKAECSCYVNSHLLPLAQAIVAFEPVRRWSKSNTAKGFCYFSSFKLFWEIIEYTLVGILNPSYVGFWKKLLGNAGFAWPASSHNYADLPIIGLYW